MTLTTKILIFIFAIFIVGTAGFVIYKQHEISARQDTIEKSIVAQKELADNILRSMSQYTTKQDLESFAKDSNINLNAIKNDLEKLSASVTAINTIRATSTGQVVTGIPSTHVTPGDNPNPPPTIQDPYGYQTTLQTLTLNEQFSNVQVPIGDVSFSAWKDKPWSLNIKPREYTASTVIGTDENQRIYTYNKFSVQVDGKPYDIKISNAEIKQEYPEAKFGWWNPRLFLGLDGGIKLNRLQGEAAPSLSLQIMSYGRYKTQPDLSILQVGLGYEVNSQKPSVILSPLQYNIGKQLPLISNTYIGPSLSVNLAGDISVMAGLRIGL